MAKTCGMCAHGINRLVSCWELDPQGSHHAQNEPACHKFAERKQDGMCSCNKSRGYDDLLERYQQLEQIAWEMFQDIESAFVRGKFKPEAYADYRDRLEAAGVETYGFKTEGEDD